MQDSAFLDLESHSTGVTPDRDMDLLGPSKIQLGDTAQAHPENTEVELHYLHGQYQLSSQPYMQQKDTTCDVETKNEASNSTIEVGIFKDVIAKHYHLLDVENDFISTPQHYIENRKSTNTGNLKSMIVIMNMTA